MADTSFHLGDHVDPSTGERRNEPVDYNSADLTTHAVIVGMTGSGKTGLGVAFIEEAMLDGIPCLVIDPKGDMTNLALTFPELAPANFRPFIDEAEAARTGSDPETLAVETAAKWRSGLESWGIDGERIRALRNSAPVTIYTPGSGAGIPLNIVGSLAAPNIGWEGNEEVLRDEIEGFVSSLLTLAGIDADPIAAPEHILAATIIEHAWSQGLGLDLASLIGSVIEPPFRKLGVFDIDVFFPKKDRTALAMKLNGLVASPSFAAWLEGPPLDIDTLLTAGGPRTAVIYLAHLSDAERQFVVTLLLSKVVTWMRRQQGTGSLRALVYMDEVFGYAPPTAEPPSKKPILTLLKQARAFGVGLVLSTQNPVDLDYKAMSNAGTWMIGRLQTERDKARILDGVASATGGVDTKRLSELISSLGERHFVLHSVRDSQPTMFTTRWVMSYLAGPLTRDQLGTLSTGSAPTAQAEAPRAPVPITDDATVVAPPVAAGTVTRWVAPSAPWLREVGGTEHSALFAPAAVTRVHLRYDDHHADVDHSEDYEAVIYPLDSSASHLHAVDYDNRDFLAEPPADGRYQFANLDLASSSFWKGIERAVTDRLVADRSVTVFKNPDLKLYSRVGETRKDFDSRCRTEAEHRADKEVSGLVQKYESRIRTAKEAIRRAENRVRELEVDVESRKQTELLTGAGDLLGALLGGRRGSTGLRHAVSRRSQTRRTEERLTSADDELTMEQEQLVALEDDLARDVEEITTHWASATDQTEELIIGLERSDVRAEPPFLAWLPIR